MSRASYQVTMSLLTPFAIAVMASSIATGSVGDGIFALLLLACDLRIKKITESTK